MTKKVCAPGLIVLLSLVCIASIASAQTSWARVYGGPDDDVGSSVQPTTDGGYVIAGFTYSFGAGDGDFWMIKTDATGDTLWTRTYGGSRHDAGCSGQQTSDGGYVFVGYTESFGKVGGAVYLVKTNASGDTLWTRTYGDGCIGYSVRQTTDGGYIIAGGGNNDVYVVKTDAQGDTLWTRTYGGSGYDEGRYVYQTTDGGYIIAGGTNSFGAKTEDVYLIKTNASGDTVWTRTYGGAHEDDCFSVQQAADSGYIIAGFTCSFGQGTPDSGDVYLIKTNASGDSQWTRTYGGAGDDVGTSVQQTTDGGYVMAGYSNSFSAGDHDVYLIKTNASGDTLWTRTYGGTSWDEGWSVRQTANDGYVIAGYTDSYGAGSHDVYIIKTDANGYAAGTAEPLTRHSANPTRFLVQPNPFTSFARITGHETELFTLSDVAGRQVALCKGDRVGVGLRPGIYFLSSVGHRTGKAVTATIIKAAD